MRSRRSVLIRKDCLLQKGTELEVKCKKRKYKTKHDMNQLLRIFRKNNVSKKFWAKMFSMLSKRGFVVLSEE